MNEATTIESSRQRDYSVPEAAAMLSVSRQAVLGFINRGSVRATKNDRGHYRISADDLAAPVLAKRKRDLAMTTPAAAAVLGTSDRQVRRYIEAGWLDADRIGTEWLIDPSSVESFIHPGRGRSKR